VSSMNIGILHPGEMGISIAASAQNSGQRVYWVSQGRSPKSHQRAGQHGLLDAGTIERLCETCSVIVSVCPPHAAEAVAQQVAAQGFRGLYLDANAISPQRARQIERVLASGGATCVDGGIIGGPAWEAGKTWLYLSGSQAEAAAALFSAGPLATRVIGAQIGQASALKMCFAAYTKGSTALLCAALATAEALGVRAELERTWSQNGSGFADEAAQRVRRVTAKAWRFAGEMDEIAATFQAAGLPGGFHQGAAEVYRRISAFKDAPQLPELAQVLAALRQVGEGPFA
jgi:3-hydroxyisobutyrate dehydrogenase-like beta-hydroxyacid dehydrogenase